MFGTLQGLGIGTALAILLYTAAFLMLRTDISRKEQWFLGVMAVLNATAAGLNLSPDSHYNLLVAMFLPLAVIFLPRKEGNGYVPGTRYVSWLEYRFFRMNQVRKAAQGLRGKLPLAASVAIGISLFLFFLSIFADGNPVVASVRTAMNELAVRYLSCLLPSREMFIHFLLWGLGSLSFGILTMHRSGCHPFRSFPCCSSTWLSWSTTERTSPSCGAGRCRKVFPRQATCMKGRTPLRWQPFFPA